MRPIDEMSGETARKIRYILHDVDDTITREGKLEASAYAALWRLREHGYRVITVTGRPAGWCDMMARQWPIDAVIGENGAFLFYEQKGRLEQLYHPEARRERGKEVLKRIQKRVLSEVPGCAIAKDQFGRLFDLAIDFAEESGLGLEEADRIREICEEEGAICKISSIHVNTWVGAYDKLGMAEIALKQLFGYSGEREEVIFFGDSPNDEPMFAHFPVCCGVANINEYLTLMEKHPSYVTRLPAGEGFAEAVDIILKRSKN